MKVKLILKKKPGGINEFYLKFTDKGKTKLVRQKVSFTSKEWSYNATPGKRKNELKRVSTTSPNYKQYVKHKKEVKGIIEPYQKAIDDLIHAGNPFGFDSVFRMVGSESKEFPKMLYEIFEHKVNHLRDNEQYSTAQSNVDTMSKLKKFIPNDIYINELDEERLLAFKKWMEVSNSTKRIHLANIRAVFGYAIKNKVEVKNPFTYGSLMTGLSSGGRSIALSYNQVNELRRMHQGLEVGSPRWEALSYFMFGYLGRGINYQDIARLKWSDYRDGRIYYVRHKTKGKSGTLLSFPLNDELKAIISHYRSVQPLNSIYIFPILNDFHQTEKSKYYRIQKERRTMNRELKLIGEELGLNFPFTTYVWRHTFASVGKKTLGLSNEQMREFLDHADQKTTDAYLAKFDEDEQDKALAGL